MAPLNNIVGLTFMRCHWQTLIGSISQFGICQNFSLTNQLRAVTFAGYIPLNSRTVSAMYY